MIRLGPADELIPLISSIVGYNTSKMFNENAINVKLVTVLFHVLCVICSIAIKLISNNLIKPINVKTMSRKQRHLDSQSTVKL